MIPLIFTYLYRRLSKLKADKFCQLFRRLAFFNLFLVLNTSEVYDRNIRETENIFRVYIITCLNLLVNMTRKRGLRI